MRKVICGTVLGLLWLMAGPVSAADKSAIEAAVSRIGTVEFGGRRIGASATVRRAYEARDYEPIWTSNRNQRLLSDLQDALRTAEDHGLDGRDYHLSILTGDVDVNDDIAIELLATDAYLTFAAHLLGGKLNPVSIEPDWTAARRSRDLAAHLLDAVADGAVRRSLEALSPPHAGYRTLQRELAVYRVIAAGGGWVGIEAGPALKLGAEGARVGQLRSRLVASGDLVAGEVDAGETFDARLEQAVKVFQRRANLDDDGVVGSRTLAELNRSPTDRIATLRANLERWRWLPEDLGERHIRVNIAGFRVEAWQDRRVARIHDVVVGRTYRKTPVFSAPMTYLILNPWWEVPPNLARKDKLPQFREDPTVISRLGYQIVNRDGKAVDASSIDWQTVNGEQFAYRIRQRPGPDNALGKVKMMLPNRHNVYLHDTPSKELFDRTRRDFSSGCIRVKDPFDLVEWLLDANGDWPRTKIDDVVASGRETRVELREPVMVHILYLTAVVGPEDTVRFVDDVYDRDARLIAALDRR